MILSDSAALAPSFTIPVSVDSSMPSKSPKTARGANVAVSRQAGKVLKAAQDAANIQQQRSELKSQLKNLYKESRARQRKISMLKKKAAKVDLSDLMQMLMMKAYVHNVRHQKEVEKRTGTSQSSTDVWMPRDGVEALDRLRLLASSCTDPEVTEFAKNMQLVANGASASSEVGSVEREDPEQ